MSPWLPECLHLDIIQLAYRYGLASPEPSLGTASCPSPPPFSGFSLCELCGKDALVGEGDTGPISISTADGSGPRWFEAALAHTGGELLCRDGFRSYPLYDSKGHHGHAKSSMPCILAKW